MRRTITISLPEEMQKELDRIAAQEGNTRSDVVRESLRDYLFVKRFRSLRRKMKSRAKGVFTDQDVFDRIS